MALLATLLAAAALAGAGPAPEAPPAPATAAQQPAAKPAAPAAKPKPKAPADPVATVREAERRLLETLDEGKGSAALGAVAAEYVDYEDLAKRSLGRHWAAQTKADRAALVAALRALLEASYLTRLQPGAPVRTEVSVVRRQGADAELHLAVSSGERQVPIDLRLQRGPDGRWRVYDATVAGLALLEGYQEQFPQLIELGGMKRLLAQLEQERQEQLRRGAPPQAAPPAPPAR
jgi:phospholipid transport system substrate-binding protein